MVQLNPFLTPCQPNARSPLAIIVADTPRVACDERGAGWREARLGRAATAGAGRVPPGEDAPAHEWPRPEGARVPGLQPIGVSAGRCECPSET